MPLPPHWFDPDNDDDEVEEVDPPDIAFTVTDQEVLGELYGPNGEVMFYLVDKRSVDGFGFRARSTSKGV